MDLNGKIGEKLGLDVKYNTQLILQCLSSIASAKFSEDEIWRSIWGTSVWPRRLH